MADLRVLKDVDTDQPFYPYTVKQAVIDEDGNEVFPMIEEEINEVKNELSGEIVDLENNLTAQKNIAFPIMENGIYDVSKGEPRAGSKFQRTVDFTECVTNCVKVSCNCTVLCFDENNVFLRTTTPLVQGNTRIAYLDQDVAKIKSNIEKGDILTYNFIDYVFPFEYEEVNYYYGASGTPTEVEKAYLYNFDYPLFNIPFYGISTLVISGENGGGKSLKANRVVYFNDGLQTNRTNFTIPIKNGENVWYARVGKPYKPFSMCCYGTSITNVNNEGKYPLSLRGLIECDISSFTIRGVSGGRYSNQIKANILADTNTYDIILMEGVANDWYYDVPLETLETAIHDICEHIIPRCKIALFVIDHTNRSYGSMVGGATVKNSIGFTSREYYKKVAEMFASYGVITIDAGMLSGINEFTGDYYVDQIHHSSLGGYVFATAISDEMKRLGIVEKI